MDDVNFIVLELQSIPVFKRDPNGPVVSDPNQLLPRNELLKAGQAILDPTKPNGLNIGQVRYADAGLDTPEKKARAAGQLFALERFALERVDPAPGDVRVHGRLPGGTRLYFVWVPGAVIRRLEKADLPAPLNAHILFHPPAYEEEYRNTRPYWGGRNPKSNQAHYVDLGIRYSCSDFRAIAHHLLAVSEKDPYLMYVVPVADNDHNFSDFIDPPKMVRILREIYEFLARRFSPRKRPQFDQIGRIMLSGYSRSGNRLTEIMKTLNKHQNFFADHLSQINAFDVNLGNNDKERLPVFTEFWDNLKRWKNKVNRRARACIYTAYASHFSHVRSQPATRSDVWNLKELNLDRAPWFEGCDDKSVSTDNLKKKLPATSRGVAFEGYNADASFALVHLPISLFQWYIGSGQEFVGNSTHGMAYCNYRIGALHGHGLFLRVLMSHAFAHAESAFYMASQ